MICWARVHLVNFAFFLIKTITAMKKLLLGLSLMHLKIKHKNMQMRRFQLLLSIVLLLVAVPCFGQSIKINDIKYKVISDTEASLVDGFRAKGDVVIPEYVTIKGRRYKITSIGDYAFKKKKDGKYEKKNRCTVNSIVMPNSITSIGNSAFAYCDLLSSINLSDSLIFIGNDAFEFCEDLKNITLPNSVIDIGRGAFSFSGIESIIIPDGVTCLNLQLFSYSSLESIILPNSITKIDSYIFSNCKRLRNVTLPNSITEIGYSIFERCENLKTIVVPDTTTIKRHRLMDKNPWGLAKVPTIVGHNGKCPDWVVDDVLSNPEYYNGDWQNWAKEQVKSNALAEQASGVGNEPSIKDEEVKEPLVESVESENKYPTLSDVFSNVRIKQLSDGFVSFERMFPLIDEETVKKVYLNEFNSDYKFYDGFVCVQNSESGRLGFINENGEVLKGGFRWHAPSYENPKFVGGLTIVKEIIPIKDKFAMATREEKWYILNKEGETIQIDYPIYQATSFNEDGIAGILIHENFKYRLRYINSKGEIVFGHLSGLCNQLRNIGSLRDGLATYYDDRTNMYGYINKEGEIVIPAQYDYAEDFSEGLAIVRTNIEGASKHIFIDTKGNQAFDKHFTKCPLPFSMGYSLVQKTNGTYVYINKEGTVCSEEYKRATSFYPNGLAFAMIDHKTKVVIDCDMNTVSTLGREIFSAHYFNGVYWNGSNTFFDYKGDEITIRTGDNGSLKSVSDNGLIYLKSQDGMYDKPIEGFIDCTTGKYRFIFEEEEF